MRQDHERAEMACREALRQMRQGKLVQPRRLLEAALRDDPYYLPTRIALIELALRESKPSQAVRESKRATSIAFSRCREAGVRRGDYASHTTGRLLLRALAVGGRAHLAAGDTDDAINAFAVVLHEDRADRYEVCPDLIGIFLDQGRPEGVMGLHKLGYTRGLSLLDVVLAALTMGAADLALVTLIEALEQVSEARAVLESLVLPRDSDDMGVAPDYVMRRQPTWIAMPGVRYAVRGMLEHPIVARTLELVAEIDDDPESEADEELAEVRSSMFANLRSDPVVQTVLKSLAS